MPQDIVSDLGYGDFPYCIGPLPFDPSSSILAGLTTTQLQANLLNAQTAYNLLLSGGKPVTVQYDMADGKRSVEYQMTNAGALVGYIQLLQSQLGIVTRARRPISMAYR